MTTGKTKRQLRAEAAGRLNAMAEDPTMGSVAVAALGKPVNGWEWRNALIDLLQDDEPPEGDAVSLLDTREKLEAGCLVRSLGPTSGTTPAGGSIADSREKLEADVRKLVVRDSDVRAIGYPMVHASLESALGWLARQAAITEREIGSRIVQDVCDEWMDAKERELAELRSKVDELAEERDHYQRKASEQTARACHLQAKVDALEAENADDARAIKDLGEQLHSMTGSRDYWMREEGKNGEEIGKLRNRERELVAMLENMRCKRELPDGIAWPRFESGELVKLRDEVVDISGNAMKVNAIKLDAHGYTLYNVTNATEIAYGRMEKRPPLTAHDGQPIEIGQTLYGLSDGKGWRVLGIERGKSHPVVATSEHSPTVGSVVTRDLKPEWLTHEKPDSPEAIAETVRDWRMFDPDAPAVTVQAYLLDDLIGRIEKMGGKA